MEPVGLAVGIAGLAGILSTCLDVIERVDIYKDFDRDSRSLAAQFAAGKLRLKQWAYDVGFREGKLSDDHHAALDEPQVRLVTRELLNVIKEVCGGSATTFQQRTLQPETGLDVDFTMLTYGIDSLQSSQRPKESRRQKLAWSLRGKARHASQVERFGVLVEFLHDLVPPNSATSNREPVTGSGEACKHGHDNRTWLNELRQTLCRLEEEMEAETRRDLRTWLGCPPPTDLFHESKQKRLERTCDWVLIRHEFVEWLAPCAESVNTEKLLWINGPAGLGKTVLCASIVEYLMSTSQAPVAYYFLSSDFESRDNPYAVVRSWVHQLTSCNQVAYQLARDVWLAQHEESATQVEVVNLLRQVVQVIPGVFLVLDGLDECTWLGKSQHDNKSLRGFLNAVTQAVADTCSRILVVSRDEPEIRSGMFNSTRCRELKIVPEYVQSDVARYSRSIVDRMLPKKDDATRQSVSLMLANRSNGKFLWIKLHQRSLQSWKNQRQLEAAINHIPPDLEASYERNWARISGLSETARERAYNILQWTAFALRPLTVNEISEAVLIDEGSGEFPSDELPDEINDDFIDSEIQTPCGSLLEIRGNPPDVELGLRTVHLTHFSIKQHFLRNISAQRPPDGDSRISNEILQRSRLAKLCLRYINSSHFRGSEEDVISTARKSQLQEKTKKNYVKRSFQNYATVSWYEHLAHGYDHDDTLSMLVCSLFDVLNPSWRVWRELFETWKPDIGLGIDYRAPPRHGGPLHYATKLGIAKLVSDLIQKGEDLIDSKAPFGRTALNIASSAGNLQISQILLDAGADCSISNEAGSTPLIEATHQGALDVVKLLLERGADHKASNNDKWTALNLASHHGYPAIVMLLLQQGADISSANAFGWSPLNAASYHGNLEVVKLLLQEGATVSQTNHDARSPRSPIHWASVRGHHEIVEILLEKGADVEAVAERGWKPLHMASSLGHLKTVKLLLANGADTKAVNEDKWTPGYLAASNGHVEVVNQLMNSGDDCRDTNTLPDSISLEGVSRAWRDQPAGILPSKPLVENPTIGDVTGWTELHEASRRGHAEVVRFLLQEGNNDQSLADNRGWTPLHAASLNGHLGVAKVLLEGQGCKENHRDNNGRTPLFYASARGHHAVVKLLVHHYRADPRITDRYGSTPLSVACRNGHEEIVEYLLSLDNNLFESRDVLNRSLLWWARKGGNQHIVGLVIQTGSKLGIGFSEEDVPGTQSAEFVLPASWCDICMRSILDEQAHYNCSLCDGGDFDICLECEADKLKCQTEGHAWDKNEPQKEEAGLR
ncbi:hypothetical protein CNYM01_04244 [Colletotrichum nymphaeae SA-01]|uniref:Uncharacterized protein n=1 Tax=Colletotrichum nymphaeae SA-01 TaxID=1460502 RepID=A0A135STZ9_9PEZI|nr:hypothetical protein CNYM01_04244 [Colletotrichum nymphaeae SA-01]